MKKITALFVATLVSVGIFAATYEKVTSAPADWSGEYLIVYEKSETEALVWNGVDKYQNHEEIAINQEVITATADVVTVTIASEADGYSLLVKGGENNGKYIGVASFGNGLKFTTNAVSNSIDMEESGVKLSISFESGDVYLCYNAITGQNGDRFRYYKNTTVDNNPSQYPLVQLYKKYVNSNPATALTLDKTTLELLYGQEATLTAALTPEDATSHIVWTSSDNMVAVVSNGKVKAVGQGNATITATAEEGVYATCQVTVTTVPATAITLSEEELTLQQYKRATLVATLIPENSTANVIWTTSDNQVVTVDNGQLYAVGLGTTHVVAAADDGGVNAACEVTVIEPTILTCAEAAEIALAVEGDNVPAEDGMYVIRGYVTEVYTNAETTLETYGNYSFYMADKEGGENVFQAFQVAPISNTGIVAVDDYVEVVGELTKYKGTPETLQKTGTVRKLSDQTKLENAVSGQQSTKTIENGQLIIIREGVKYNAQGVKLN